MRRGFSLIELLAVIAASSVVFSVMAVSLYTLGRTQTAVQDEAHAAAALHDFARRLRADAHAAAEVIVTEVEDAADDSAIPSLTLHFDDGQDVVYDYNPQKSVLRRRVVQNDQTSARESFVVPRGSRVQWQAPGDEEPLLVVLVTRPAGTSANSSWRTTRIEAAVGLERVEFP